MQDVLKAAVSLHHAGKLAQAAALYQNVLATEPENAEAMHLLGVLSHQQGAHARAIELISRAVAHRPNNPAFHANLAEAYRAAWAVRAGSRLVQDRHRLEAGLPRSAARISGWLSRRWAAAMRPASSFAGQSNSARLRAGSQQPGQRAA